jgi:hypothetical protein
LAFTAYALEEGLALNCPIGLDLFIMATPSGVLMSAFDVSTYLMFPPASATAAFNKLYRGGEAILGY